MRTRNGLAQLAIGLAAGYAATKATKPIQKALSQVTPDHILEKEAAVRPGKPSLLAVEKASELVGVELDPDTKRTVGKQVHYGFGMAWGMVYLLYRESGMPPIPAGLATGTNMSLVLDECLTPAFRFNAANRHYPLQTHVRGLLAHLGYGLAAAAVAETLARAGGVSLGSRH